MARAAAGGHEGAQAGSLLSGQRAIVAAEEAVERRRRNQRRLLVGGGAAIVPRVHRLCILRIRLAESRQVVELADGFERRLPGGEAKRAGERAFGLLGAGLAVRQPAQCRLGHRVENGRRVPRSQGAARVGREGASVGAPVAREVARAARGLAVGRDALVPVQRAPELHFRRSGGGRCLDAPEKPERLATQLLVGLRGAGEGYRCGKYGRWDNKFHWCPPTLSMHCNRLHKLREHMATRTTAAAAVYPLMAETTGGMPWHASTSTTSEESSSSRSRATTARTRAPG